MMGGLGGNFNQIWLAFSLRKQCRRNDSGRAPGLVAALTEGNHLELKPAGTRFGNPALKKDRSFASALPRPKTRLETLPFRNNALIAP